MSRTINHSILILLASGSVSAGVRSPVVIAHRGASGYLPEHTLEAKAMAHAMRPDYIEQDVVLTRDGVPVILHDHYLDTVTDVATLFPDRKRPDGRYYAIDFTREEIGRLVVHERIDLQTGRPVYPGRFPIEPELRFRVPTLDQEIRLIQGLNRSTGREVGLYVELKAPWFHRQEGRDIARAVLEILAAHGYTGPDSNAFIQCFDPTCLRLLRKFHRTRLRLVQLIAWNAWKETPGVDYDRMLTPEGLKAIAGYADGIGPSLDMLIRSGASGAPELRTDIVRWAHDAGLLIHPYTVRVDELPPPCRSVEELVRILFGELRVDGVFSDFPDRVTRPGSP